ncbi:hypothetical protein [Microvirga sp. BSC39]|uniref:RipA family octameric membrane protein n=1 Tax=Microvirga sp. BSC39 TaxID=1549810 RepID=UPI001269EE64|nr:hypothetical protein [Microvirga sp. BSC39]
MNTFYVTINTAIFALIGAKADILSVRLSSEYFPVPIIALTGIAVCCLWFMLISVYKSLTDDKYKIICALEGRLPSKPFTDEANDAET